MPAPNRWIRRRTRGASVDGAPRPDRTEVRRRVRSYRNVTDAIRAEESRQHLPSRERLPFQSREAEPRGRRQNEGQGFWPFPFRRR